MPFSKRREGFTVILFVGVLALLVMIGVAFVVNTRLEVIEAENYNNSVKTRYLAQGGINHAIAELKEDARNNFAYSGISFGTEEPSYGSGDYKGEYTITIQDEQKKININNNTENPNLAQLLKNVRGNLPTFPIGVTITDDDCQNIVDNAPYETKEQIQAVLGMDPDKYNDIRGFITIHSYKDPNCGNRTPININTAHFYMLKSVLEGLDDGSTLPIQGADMAILAGAIQSDITNNGPFSHPDGWKRFEDLVKTKVSDEKAAVIVKNCNPNADNKGDLIVQTTEFCFHSGGYYSIVASAEISKNGNKIAEKKLVSIVKIYDIWNETTKAQFADTNAVPFRVNWKDSCPINYDSLEIFLYNPNNAIIIPNALKAGFWDDFEEDYGLLGTDKGDWLEQEQSVAINESGNSMLRTWPSGGFVAGVDYFPKVELDKNKWRFDNFSIRVRMIDETDGIKDVNRVNLPWPAVPGGSGDPWWGAGKAPGGCPDPPGPISTCCHERYMNVGHIQFGSGDPFPAIYLGYPQTYYREWVNYLGDGYIYFAPDPGMKPEPIITNPHLYVVFNYWTILWWGTQVYSVPSYKSDKTFQFRSKGQRDLKGVVYYSGGSTSFDGGTAPLSTAPTNQWENRYINLVGMGNLFDAKNIRLIPGNTVKASIEYPSGEYTSIEPPSVGTIEQGTVTGTVTLLDVDLATTVDLDWANPGSSTSIKYEAIFHVKDADIEDTPVLEDVFVTYFKPTETLYYREID